MHIFFSLLISRIKHMQNFLNLIMSHFFLFSYQFQNNLTFLNLIFLDYFFYKFLIIFSLIITFHFFNFINNRQTISQLKHEINRSVNKVRLLKLFYFYKFTLCIKRRLLLKKSIILSLFGSKTGVFLCAKMIIQKVKLNV